MSTLLRDAFRRANATLLTHPGLQPPRTTTLNARSSDAYRAASTLIDAQSERGEGSSQLWAVALWSATCALGLGAFCWDGRLGDAEGREPGSDQKRQREFQEWMRQRGADVESVEVCESKEGGFGLCTSEDVKRHSSRSVFSHALDWVLFRQSTFRMASFPLSMSICPIVACNDDRLGPYLQTLVRHGEVDAETTAILFIMFQKLLGEDSQWKEWVELLPKEFQVPVLYDEIALKELKGTTLHSAAIVQKNMLNTKWESLEEPCRTICSEAGISKMPTAADFFWAGLVYWSRAVAVPNGDGRERNCVIPGLDFCNHSQEPNARWRPPRKSTKSEMMLQKTSNGQRKDFDASMIDLVVDKRLPPADQELFINYGDKSNEELLFSHGFTIDMNPNERLMINCPIVENSGEELLPMRLELLAMQGLRPQFFLEGGETLEEAKRAAQKFEERRAVKGKINPKDKGLMHVFPPEIWDIMEAFVVEPKELEAKRRAVESGVKKGRSGSKLEETGVHMAKVTTLVMLLEMKMAELEGVDGTGSLEEDIKKMEEVRKEELEGWQWSCLVYRAEQKRLTREWLFLARIHMQEVMVKLQWLYDAQPKTAGR
ncbi:hypothetical protein BSKO_01716 [Bryopsis sp. KO-2023]|nr:hypothetical protein BSKO_01716 [Bryopsis sp. KO-2023]